MNQEQFIDVVTDLSIAFIKAGGEVKETNKETTFKLGKYQISLYKPYINLRFMGTSVTQVKKGWPYNSISIQSRAPHKFEDKPSQAFIDSIAKMIDGIKDDIFNFSWKQNDMTLLSNLQKEAFQSHRFNPRRESYQVKKQTESLLNKEIKHFTSKRREYHKQQHDKYQPFLEVKKQLPHSLKQVNSKGINLTKINSNYYRADLVITVDNNTFELVAWEHDPYRTIQKLDDALRSELTDFGKDIYMNKHLRPYDFLLATPIEDIIKAA